MKNKVVIKITKIKDFGRNHDSYCDKVLMLRKARRVGDTEVVNHYQLGTLSRMKGEEFDFVEL